MEAQNRVNAIKHGYFYLPPLFPVLHVNLCQSDGNGRKARLISNIILLKAGLPPVVIEKSLRREYIECLADYQIKTGQLTNTTGLWPNDQSLEPFEVFCESSYLSTKSLMEKASS